LREVSLIAESAVEERAIAFQAVQRLVGTADALFVVEEVCPVETTRADLAAVTGDAALKGGIASHALTCFAVSVVEVFLAGEAIVLVLASPAVRQACLAQVAHRSIEVICIGDTLRAHVLISASLTTRTEISARNALTAIHKGCVQTFGAAGFRARLTIFELL